MVRFLRLHSRLSPLAHGRILPGGCLVVTQRHHDQRCQPAAPDAEHCLWAELGLVRNIELAGSLLPRGLPWQVEQAVAVGLDGSRPIDDAPSFYGRPHVRRTSTWRRAHPPRVPFSAPPAIAHPAHAAHCERPQTDRAMLPGRRRSISMPVGGSYRRSAIEEGDFYLLLLLLPR